MAVVALADSRRFVVDGGGINLAHWKDALAASRRRMTPEAFAAALVELEAHQRRARRLHRR